MPPEQVQAWLRTAPPPTHAQTQQSSQRHTQGPIHMSLTSLHVTCHRGIRFLHRNEGENNCCGLFTGLLLQRPPSSRRCRRVFPPPLGYPQKTPLLQARLFSASPLLPQRSPSAPVPLLPGPQLGPTSAPLPRLGSMSGMPSLWFSLSIKKPPPILP